MELAGKVKTSPEWKNSWLGEMKTTAKIPTEKNLSVEVILV